LRELISKSFIQLLIQFAVIVVQFLYFKFLNKEIEFDYFGQISIVVSITTVMSVFMNNNLSILWHKGDEHQKGALTDLLGLLHLIGSLVIIMVMFLFDQNQWLPWILVAVAFYLDSFHLRNKWRLEKEKRFNKVSTINSIALLGSYFFMYSSIKYWPNSLGLSLVILVAAILRLLLFKAYFNFVFPNLNLLKPFLKEYRDLILLSGLNSFIWNMDKWIVLRLFGYNFLGVYSRILALVEMPLKASSSALSKLRLVYFIDNRDNRRDSNAIIAANIVLNSILMVCLLIYADVILAMVNIPGVEENLKLFKTLIWIFPIRILIRDLDTYFKSTNSLILSIMQKLIVIVSFVIIYLIHYLLVLNSINLMVISIGISSLLYLLGYVMVQLRDGD